MGRRESCWFCLKYMDADEREIYYYLKAQAGELIPASEIGRRAAGKRRFHEEHDWAKPVLLRMAERGILESDEAGRYRLKPMPKKDTRGKKWASQELAKILEQSGKVFKDVMTIEDADDYYDRL